LWPFTRTAALFAWLGPVSELLLPGSDDWSGMQIATAAERPELLGPAWEATKDTLPGYNNHGDVLNEYWPRLTEERPDFQFHLAGDGGEMLARARSIPLRWDGTLEDLPAGIDGAIARSSR
jgi:hypothetical protein